TCPAAVLLIETMHMEKEFITEELPIGIVGLGLMGCSIVTCLLMAGHPVIAVAPLAMDLLKAEERIRGHLSRSGRKGLVGEAPEAYFSRLQITEDYTLLAPCALVIEC